MRLILTVSLYFIMIFSINLVIASQSARASAWEGKPISSLLQKLGMPDLVMPAANGNTLYSYTKETSKAYVPQNTVNSTTFVGPKGTSYAANIPTPPNNNNYIALTCTTVYEVNKQKIIVSVSRKGNGCRN